jgi:ubiquinone/menaquinone biosynthesis methyltransferase
MAQTSHVPLPGESEERGQAVRAMFDRIAPTYDLLNRVMTLRVDVRWRRKLIAELRLREGEHLLDLCAGTMDVAAEARRQAPGARITGADFSIPMLARGARKTGLPAVASDALRVPFRPREFDAVTVAFGVRNLESLERGVDEIARVLKPGGRLGVLEFFRAESKGSRLVHGVYNKVALPVLGRALSADASAYQYLVESMERFVTMREFEALLPRRGFGAVRARTLFPGVCGLVVAERTA